MQRCRALPKLTNPTFRRSCDEAFSVREAADEGLVSLSVIPRGLTLKDSLTTAVVVPITVIGILCVAAFLWYDYKRRQNDMIWKVKQEELHFDDPPEVIGQGTFGLVLLAGTKRRMELRQGSLCVYAYSY